MLLRSCFSSLMWYDGKFLFKIHLFCHWKQHRLEKFVWVSNVDVGQFKMFCICFIFGRMRAIMSEKASRKYIQKVSVLKPSTQLKSLTSVSNKALAGKEEGSFLAKMQNFIAWSEKERSEPLSRRENGGKAWSLYWWTCATVGMCQCTFVSGFYVCAPLL